jgi:hypothetical protein
MSLDRQRLESGMSYAQFKAQMTKNQERFETNERRVEIRPDDLAAFKRLPRPVNVLVLAEDWCGDVVANLPVLGRLAAESSRLNLKIFLRDQNLDLSDDYLKEGKYRSIPVMAFLDDDLRELGRFIERPASVTKRREQERRTYYAAHPELGSPERLLDELPEAQREQVNAAMQSIRDAMLPYANAEVVKALRQIVEGVPSVA